VNRFREPTLSPEAAAYLAELRALSADEFREKRVLEETMERSRIARSNGRVVSARFRNTGSLRR
jgi:hypothetical protein